MRILAAALAFAAGCGGGAAAQAPKPAAPAVSAVAASPPAPAESGGHLEIPKDYVEIVIAEVLDASEGSAVLVLDESTDLVIPIFIGGTEAASIEARVAGVARPRPLTHDLLDAIVARLDGAIVKVQIDELRDSTYIGSVFLRAKGRVVRIDARPSDAIALAIGNKVPMYVARAVFDAGGRSRQEIERELGRQLKKSH
ncbi:MAG: bifunctional nuclease family protein [Deltaproteobacteria bacterium]|nr:bifunctional nuclease family protein [Deltaproteobacteria bacterium]